MPKHIRPRNPTTPVWRNPPPRAFADAALTIRQRAAARSPKRPRISPPLTSLGNERRYGRRSGFRARRRRLEQRPGWRGAARPYDAVTDEPREPAGRFGRAGARNRFEARHRAPAIDDQNCIAAFETVDEGTQTVLASVMLAFFIRAIIAFSFKLFKS